MSDKRSGSRLTLACATLVTAAAALAIRGVAPAQDTPPVAEPLAESDWPLTSSESRGRDAYERYCVGCHGLSGRGDGVAARFLDPLPRDFQSGKFKFRSTAFGELPLDRDLMRTITCGLPGSSMPGFPLLPELERKDLVRYVLHLAKFGLARRVAAAEMEADSMSLAEFRRTRLAAVLADIEATPVHVVPVSPEPPASAESVARGRELFAKSCASCHGATGRGDGPSSMALRDDRNAVIRPRDFTSGVFRAGSTPLDVFIRVKGGISGTPMPSFASLSDQEIWDLVHFAMAMKDPGATKPKMPPGCGEAGDR